MKILEKHDFNGIWKNTDMIPNWTYNNDVEITIYSRKSFSIMVSDKRTLLVEGELQVQNIENDVFEINVIGNVQIPVILTTQFQFKVTTQFQFKVST